MRTDTKLLLRAFKSKGRFVSTAPVPWVSRPASTNAALPLLPITDPIPEKSATEST